MSQWIVLLNTPSTRYAYGPIADPELAERFAAFLTKEVDPAEAIKLIDPLDEMLGYWRGKSDPELKPASWPPHPGQIWQDRDGIRWICTPAGNPSNPFKYAYLTCLARQADDGAEEIWRLFGPLTLINTIPTQDEEPPF